MGFWKNLGMAVVGTAATAIGAHFAGRLFDRLNECMETRNQERDDQYCERQSGEHNCARYFTRKANRTTEPTTVDSKVTPTDTTPNTTDNRDGGLGIKAVVA